MAPLLHVCIFCTAACAVALFGSLGIESFSINQPLVKTKRDLRRGEGEGSEVASISKLFEIGLSQ
jgi:hypothetical protein